MRRRNVTHKKKETGQHGARQAWRHTRYAMRRDEKMRRATILYSKTTRAATRVLLTLEVLLRIDVFTSSTARTRSATTRVLYAYQ